MPVNETSVAVAAMIGVLAGFLINESMGGRRSSIGVHRSDGRLLAFWPGLVLFTVVTVFSGLFSTVTAQAMMTAFDGLGALILATFGVAFFLNVQSYSR